MFFLKLLKQYLRLYFFAIATLYIIPSVFQYVYLSGMQFSSTTPYATTKFLSYIEQVAQLPNIASVSATENPVNRDADGAEQPTESDTNEADGRARNVHEPPPKNMGGGDDVCGSLEDWLHPLPTFEDSEVSHIAFSSFLQLSAFSCILFSFLLDGKYENFCS